MNAPQAPPEPRRSASGAVAAGIALSRIAGLVRELLFGAAFGASAAGDALRAAIRLPNLLQNLLGEGVLSASFIPVYSRMLAEERHDDARRLARATLGLLCVLSGAIAIVIIVAARPLTTVLATGFSGERFELTVELTRYVAVGAAFLVPSAWCLGVLNSHRRFFLSYVAPVAWNLVQIVVLTVVVVVGVDTGDAAVAAAWALAAGGLVQFLVQVPGVRAVHGSLGPTLDRDAPGLPATVRRFGQAIVGRGAAQIIAYVDLWLATWLATGAVTILGLAQILYLLPISLFAMSVAAAELPELARAGADDPDRIHERTRRGLIRILVPVCFVAAVYVAAPQPLVGALFERGRFGRDETIGVALVLTAFGLALVPAAVSRLLQNTLYALDEVAWATRASILRLSVAAAVGAVVMFPFDRLLLVDHRIIGLLSMDALSPLPEIVREDGALPLRLGAVGLAVGASVGAWVELFWLRRRILARTGRTGLLGTVVVRLAVATAVAAVVLVVTTRLASPAPPWLRAGASVVPAGVAYLAVLISSGVEEAGELVAVVRRMAGRVIPGLDRSSR